MVESSENNRRAGNGGVIFAIIALALILAIGFFFLVESRHDPDPAEVLTETSRSIDDGARIVGDAARNAADSISRPD